MNDDDFLEPEDVVRMSRTGLSGPGGCTEVTKILLPMDLDIELRQKAARSGVSVSAYARDVMCLHLRGLFYSEIVGKSRREALMKEGQEKDMNQSFMEAMRRRGDRA